MEYIIVMRDTKFWLIGPFASQKDAADYGIQYLAPGGEDDPRWQTIRWQLNTFASDTYIGAKVYTPNSGRYINETTAESNYTTYIV
jgi:hypothetical protein